MMLFKKVMRLSSLGDKSIGEVWQLFCQKLNVEYLMISSLLGHQLVR